MRRKTITVIVVMCCLCLCGAIAFRSCALNMGPPMYEQRARHALTRNFYSSDVAVKLFKEEPLSVESKKAMIAINDDAISYFLVSNPSVTEEDKIEIFNQSGEEIRAYIQETCKNEEGRLRAVIEAERKRQKFKANAILVLSLVALAVAAGCIPLMRNKRHRAHDAG